MTIIASVTTFKKAKLKLQIIPKNKIIPVFISIEKKFSKNNPCNEKNYSMPIITKYDFLLEL